MSDSGSSSSSSAGASSASSSGAGDAPSSFGSGGADAHSDHHSDSPAHAGPAAAADQERDLHDYLASAKESAPAAPDHSGTTKDGDKAAGLPDTAKEHGPAAAEHHSGLGAHEPTLAELEQALAALKQEQAEADREKIAAMPTIGPDNPHGGPPHSFVEDNFKTMHDARESVMAALAGIWSRLTDHNEHQVQVASHDAKVASDVISASVGFVPGANGASLPGQESPQQMVDKASAGGYQGAVETAPQATEKAR